MGFMKRQVVFNMDNTHQRELYEWISIQSEGNFSGYVRTVLFAFRSAGSGQRASLGNVDEVTVYAENDSGAMGDIL